MLRLAIPADAGQFIEEGRNNDNVVFVDTDFIEFRDDHMEVWVKIIPFGENKKELEGYLKTTVWHAMSLFAVDIEKRQFHVIEYIMYDDDAREICLLSSKPCCQGQMSNLCEKTLEVIKTGLTFTKKSSMIYQSDFR